jgi:hypothetical protein
VTNVVTWKKALLLALVVLLVLIGLPILMPGGAMACPDCGPATTAYSVCLIAVLAEAAIAAIILIVFLRSRTQDPPILLRAVSFDRPPRLG